MTDLLSLREVDANPAYLTEYGDPHDPDTRKAMQGFSPLECLQPGRKYPPILMTSSLGDDRVAAHHVRVFEDRLQMLDPDRDTWILCDEDHGHWGGDTETERATRNALMRSFLDIVMPAPQTAPCLRT